jgi:hypothetical protein
MCCLYLCSNIWELLSPKQTSWRENLNGDDVFSCEKRCLIKNSSTYLAGNQLTTSIYWLGCGTVNILLSFIFVIVCSLLEWKRICISVRGIRLFKDFESLMSQIWTVLAWLITSLIKAYRWEISFFWMYNCCYIYSIFIAIIQFCESVHLVPSYDVYMLFSGCWLILSVYMIVSFDFPFVRLFGVR